MIPRPEQLWGSRQEAAILIVRRGLAQAEEKYLVDPGASLGTWFARVQETLAVASRVTVGQIEGGRLLVEEDIAGEQAGLFSDICAEAIRGAARVWGAGRATQAREEILSLVASAGYASARPGWGEVMETLVRCSAALEPLANGLRDGDLPMGEPTDCVSVAQSLLEVARPAFGAVYVLCA